jgi:hypothetical protein
LAGLEVEDALGIGGDEDLVRGKPGEVVDDGLDVG